VTLISAIFGLPRKRSAPNGAVYTWDRRGAERFEVGHQIAIGLPGTSPVAGTIINISVGGAAIRIEGWNARARAVWLAELSRGDELWMVGLLGIPISCWVVVFEGDLLRVHFPRGGSLRSLLREVIMRLTSH
jgi:hypothetical protein